MKYKFKVEENLNNRIDKYLSERLNLSRSFIKNSIDTNLVLVNGKTIKSSYKIVAGDEIVFNYIEDKIDLIPKEIDLDIIYEDSYLGVINKPKDLIVHPAKQDQQDTVVNGLIYRYKELGNMDSIRPGIVHRLDKDTTGLLVFAKRDEVYTSLVEQFSSGKVKKKYYALVHGELLNSVRIEKAIGRNKNDRKKMDIIEEGKPAISIVNPIKLYEGYTLVEVDLITGRTHQIRVHMKSINHPVVGDLVYGQENKFGINTQLLHSYYLSFEHPFKKEIVTYTTGIPEYFIDFIRRAKLEENTKQ